MLVYGESLTAPRLVGFCLVWAALLVFALALGVYRAYLEEEIAGQKATLAELEALAGLSDGEAAETMSSTPGSARSAPRK